MAPEGGGRDRCVSVHSGLIITKGVFGCAKRSGVKFHGVSNIWVGPERIHLS